ncbi:hypothetical protein KC340_g117 [Hortaea werneckii]|nr:hypothetical protein KC340_g117 [Hortaea werneckii]
MLATAYRLSCVVLLEYPRSLRNVVTQRLRLALWNYRSYPVRGRHAAKARTLNWPEAGKKSGNLGQVLPRSSAAKPCGFMNSFHPERQVRKQRGTPCYPSLVWGKRLASHAADLRFHITGRNCVKVRKRSATGKCHMLHSTLPSLSPNAFIPSPLMRASCLGLESSPSCSSCLQPGSFLHRMQALRNLRRIARPKSSSTFPGTLGVAAPREELPVCVPEADALAPVLTFRLGSLPRST